MRGEGEVKGKGEEGGRGRGRVELSRPIGSKCAQGGGGGTRITHL